jgi:hypothetical protein
VNGTMTRFLSDDQEEIGEYTSTPSLLRRYINGPAVDEHLAQVEAALRGISVLRSIQNPRSLARASFEHTVLSASSTERQEFRPAPLQD